MDSSRSATSASSAEPAHVLAGTADVSFPWAGALLLTLLAIVAILARWQARRRGRLVGHGWMPRWLKDAAGGSSAPGGLCLEASMRLDGQAQLHSVRWGDRRLLVATSPNASPVLLDSRSATEVETAS